MFVLLVSPLVLVDGLELLGELLEPEGAIAEGVPDIEPVLLEVPDGVDELSGIVLDDEEGDVVLIVDEEVVVELLPEFIPLELDGVEGLDVVDVSVVGVAGGSVLLHAPSAAKVAASATHLIELRMFTPRKSLDENARVRAWPARGGR